MAEKVDQDVRDGAIWLAKECNPDEAEWIVPYYEQGGSSPLTEILARMKEAGRQQGLREAAEVAHRTGKGCATAFALSESQNKWRTAAWAGASEHIATSITALMEGEGE